MASEYADVRHATREDVPAILTLIKELADYEGFSSAVLASEALLTKTLSFADPSSPSGWSSGYAKALLVDAPDGRTAGIAFYFNNYSTFAASPGIYLEDIYVRPDLRRRGYGQSMMSVLAKEVLTIGDEIGLCLLDLEQNRLCFPKKLGGTRF